jgi:hypothetical protein
MTEIKGMEGFSVELIPPKGLGIEEALPKKPSASVDSETYRLMQEWANMAKDDDGRPIPGSAKKDCRRGPITFKGLYISSIDITIKEEKDEDVNGRAD